MRTLLTNLFIVTAALASTSRLALLMLGERGQGQGNARYYSDGGQWSCPIASCPVKCDSQEELLTHIAYSH